MGLCDAPSGKVNKENYHKSGKAEECQRFVHNKCIVLNLDDDDGVNRGRGEPAYIDGVEQPYNPDIGERIVTRPQEFWMICDDGSHINGQWVRNCHGIRPDEVLYYRVHSQKVIFPLFVYDEVSDQWFENRETQDEFTELHREALRPQAETILLSRCDMIRVANAGVTELLDPELIDEELTNGRGNG